MNDHDDDEITPGGSRVHRHERRTVPFAPSSGDVDLIELVTEHAEEHLGPIDGVFHEIVSDLVHVDVHIIKPTYERAWTTLLTTGMAEAPMIVPTDEDGDPIAPRFAELLINLHPDWPLTQEAFEDERNYWPIRWLKILARLPHEYDTWLGWGHTIPNGDPPAELADDVGFTGMIVLPSISAPEEFGLIDVSEHKQLAIYALYPLYTEEMDLKLEHGTEALLERFADVELSDIVEVGRPNLAL